MKYKANFSCFNNLASTLVIITCCFFIISLVCSGITVYAQNDKPNASVAKNEDPDTNQVTEVTNQQPYTNLSPPQSPPMEYKFLSTPEFVLALIVAVILIIALSLQFFLLKSPKMNPDDILRVFSVNLIIMGTMFFICAGFDSSQIAPALGLFGIIAGYLLGKSEKKENEKIERKGGERNE
jgi:hypothetical protein